MYQTLNRTVILNITDALHNQHNFLRWVNKPNFILNIRTDITPKLLFFLLTSGKIIMHIQENNILKHMI